MGRRKKMISATLIKGETRLSGIKSINSTLDFGDGKSVSSYKIVIDKCSSSLQVYNSLLSKVDEAYNLFMADEKSLKNWNESMLIAIANKYGKDSNEYEMAGGKRKSERKKPKPRTSPESISSGEIQ